jgi:hypothetical protein
MSEHQFYEFRTVNRTLSREEQRDVNSWSSRGDVTPTSATFVYNYGDFKYDPEKCLLKYFDMMLYYANYGCRRMMFRFPAALVDFKALEKYTWDHEQDYEHNIRIAKYEEFVVVDIEENLEEGFSEWIESEGVLGNLDPIWTEVINGNYGFLYLIWAHFTTSLLKLLDEFDDSDTESLAKIQEPPVPAGLKNKSEALDAFMDFWGIEDDLLETVAQNSPPETATLPAPETLLAQLSETEKIKFLTSLLRNEPQTRLLLSKRLQELAGQPAAIAHTKPRTLRELLDIEVVVSTEALERYKREAAEKRRLKFEDMKNRESDIWNQVWQNLYKKTSSGYDLATPQICDLRDLADYTGEQDAFKENLLKILEQFGKSKAFMDRLKHAKLM